MKKISLLVLILIPIVIISFVIFTKAICEDEDFVFDSLINNSDYFRYKELFSGVLALSAIFYVCYNVLVPPKSIMVYLGRYEKSPPRNSLISSFS